MAFINLSTAEIEKLGDVLTHSQKSGLPAWEESLDPENLKVFQIPVGEARLVYIPNRVRPAVDEDGNETFDLDTLKAATHKVAYGTYRCLRDIDLGEGHESGLDGTCPYCDCAELSHELYTAKLEAIAAEKGIIDTKSSELEVERLKLSKDKAVTFSNTREAFPFVIIPFDVKVEKGKRIYKPKLNDKGELDLTVEVILISGYAMTEKLVKPLKSTAYASPAGLVMLFNYNYDAKGKTPNSRDAAREFTASFFGDPTEADFQWGPEIGKLISETGEALCAPFDKLTLSQKLRSFGITDMATARVTAENAIAKTRKELLMRQAADEAVKGISNNVANPAVTGGSSAEDVLNSFTKTGAQA